jgi:signal transduction histidine kinase
VLNFLGRIHNKIVHKSQEEDYPYFTYGLFQLISNPIYYILWFFVDEQSYENIWVRTLISLSCIPLVFFKRWHPNYKRFLPLYWYIVCLYTLPFFFTFMLLKNDLSYGWSLNSLTGVVLCILFLDIESLMILVPIGTFLGWLAHHITTPLPYYDFATIKTLMITYGSAFIFGGLFAQRARKTNREKIQTMKMLAGSIAHELRTPLSAIMMNSEALLRYMPYYQDAYLKATDANLLTKKLHHSEHTNFNKIPSSLQKLSGNAQTMINMLLTNLSEGNDDNKEELCSMNQCIKEALTEYPFAAPEKTMVHWDDKDDFLFLGQKQIMKHVIFNLLKNSLYAIAAVGKGKIFINLVPSNSFETKNILVFTDTGSGIAAQHLPHIFERFYTKTRHGTGIGLAFCQTAIQGFGGKISCSSKFGENTTFTITLPILKDGKLREVAF